MHLPREMPVRDRDIVAREQLRIGFALIAQRITPAVTISAGGILADIAGPQRRRTPIVNLIEASQIVLAKPLHRICSQIEASAGAAVGVERQ